jgi:Flp pilus assembly protein TadD
MMTNKHLFSVAKKTLLVSAALGSLGYGVVVASDVENFVTPKQAAHAEGKAAKALAKHKYDDAISWGSQAVLGDPHNADYRMLLAQANLSAGRFASAETLFNDVLTLDPGHQRAGLNLALTQIALDHGSDARATLDAHRAQIAPADLGLAYALAGDAPNGVRILEGAAREDNATVKTRQNLALAYALAGRWDESRVAASQDLSPDMVEKRMSDWAQMAHPKAAWEQVASLLHVTPVNDPGLPYQLALRDVPNAPVREASASAPVVPQPAPTPVAVAPAEPAPRYETAAVTNVPIAPAIAPSEPQPMPVVAPQPKPHIAFVTKPVRVATLITAEHGPAKRFIAERARAKAPMVAHHAAHNMVRMAAHHSIKSGRFAVQIGAFASAALAKSAWQRDVKKVALLHDYDPAGSQFKLRHSSFYRLSVTGFATHQEASAVCSKLRATGGACFVRGVAGDQLAAWARPAGNVRLAVKHHDAKAVVKTAKAVQPSSAKVQPTQAQAASKPAVKPAVKQTASAQRPAGGQLAAKR